MFAGEYEHKKQRNKENEGDCRHPAPREESPQGKEDEQQPITHQRGVFTYRMLRLLLIGRHSWTPLEKTRIDDRRFRSANRGHPKSNFKNRPASGSAGTGGRTDRPRVCYLDEAGRMTNGPRPVSANGTRLRAIAPSIRQLTPGRENEEARSR